MILISKYKDYYDSACYGETDPKKIWKRSEPSWCKDKIFKCSKTSHLPIIVSNHDWFHVELRIIGFCGKIYPAVVFKTPSDYTCTTMNSYVADIAYDMDEFDEMLSQEMNKKNQYTGNSYYKKPKVHKENYEIISHWFKNEYLFEKAGYNSKKTFQKFPKELNDIFLKHNTPSFAVLPSSPYYTANNDGYNPIILNPFLYSYDFRKVFNAHQCAQELDMFLFNELVPPDVVAHDVPDKIKAESHGFDKYSFRKQKEKV